MKISIITVGKKHDPNLAGAIEVYETRLKSFCDFSWTFIPSSDAEKESVAILRAIKPEDAVVLLDESGYLASSSQLALYLERSQNSSVKHVAVIIGGAYGVNRAVFDRADAVISLSKMVFPHQIVRLLAVEQLYRAYSILAGNGYHHA